MSKRLTGLQSYQSSTPFVLYNSAIFQILQIYKTASLFSPLSGKMKITNLYQEGERGNRCISVLLAHVSLL